MFKLKTNNPMMKVCAQSRGYFECCKNRRGSTSKLYNYYLNGGKGSNGNIRVDFLVLH